MKLFKNSVGRPSNETLENRKVVKLSIVTVVISFVAIILSVANLIVIGNNPNKLKGGAVNYFTVMYNANGGKGSMSNQKITYGTKTKLTKNGFTKSGYKFAGWKAKRIVNGQDLYRGCTKSGTCSNTDAKWFSESVIKEYFIYSDREEVTKTGEVGETVYMYATWKKDASSTTPTTKFNPNAVTKKPVSSKVTGKSSKNSGSIISGIFKFIGSIFNTISSNKPTKPPIINSKPSTTKGNVTPETTTPKVDKQETKVTENKPERTTCVFPYQIDGCKSEKNEVVTKIQGMLNKVLAEEISKKTLNSLKTDGYFGEETEKAIKLYQEKLKKTDPVQVIDGKVGYKELTALAKDAKQEYFTIYYYDGVNESPLKRQLGTDKSSIITVTKDGNKDEYTVQTIIRGQSTMISSKSITKPSGGTDKLVGYYATRFKKSDNERQTYGCFSAKCTTNDAGWYTDNEISTKKSNGKTFYKYVYLLGEKVSVTSSSTYKNRVNFTSKYCSQNKFYNKNTSKCENEEVNSSLRKNIFIGDSRCVGIQMSINSTEKNKSHWICEVGKGFSWLDKIAINELNSIIKSDQYYNIYINLGVNDLGNIKRYYDYFNAMVESEKYKNCKIIVVSVNPINNNKAKNNGYLVTNEGVVSFNNTMKNNLSSKITYCNTYDKIKNNFNTTDGIHYSSDTSKAIYQNMTQCK